MNFKTLLAVILLFCSVGNTQMFEVAQKAADASGMAESAAEAISEISDNSETVLMLNKRIKELRQVETDARNIGMTVDETQSVLEPLFDERASIEQKIRAVTERTRRIKRLFSSVAALTGTPNVAQVQQQMTSNLLLEDLTSQTTVNGARLEAILTTVRDQPRLEKLQSIKDMSKQLSSIENQIGTLSEKGLSSLWKVIDSIFKTSRDNALLLFSLFFVARTVIGLFFHHAPETQLEILKDSFLFFISIWIFQDLIQILGRFDWSELYQISPDYASIMDSSKPLALQAISLFSLEWTMKIKLLSSFLFLLGYIIFSILLTLLTLFSAYIILFATMTSSYMVLIVFAILYVGTAAWPLVFEVIDFALLPVIKSITENELLRSICSAGTMLIKILVSSFLSWKALSNDLIRGMLAPLTSPLKHSFTAAANLSASSINPNGTMNQLSSFAHPKRSMNDSLKLGLGQKQTNAINEKFASLFKDSNTDGSASHPGSAQKINQLAGLNRDSNASVFRRPNLQNIGTKSAISKVALSRGHSQHLASEQNVRSEAHSILTGKKSPETASLAAKKRIVNLSLRNESNSFESSSFSKTNKYTSQNKYRAKGGFN